MWADDKLKGRCEALAKETSGLLTWNWDDQFLCALAPFSVNEKDEILGILDRLMDARWDSSNIDEAPDMVTQLAQGMGGLRSGQFLFTTHASKGVFIFGAWWPWGNGQTISLRVGPYLDEISESEPDDLMTSFKACFGL